MGTALRETGQGGVQPIIGIRLITVLPRRATLPNCGYRSPGNRTRWSAAHYWHSEMSIFRILFNLIQARLIAAFQALGDMDF
nr:MAG TPA: hypothetical protein [Caudoviricetes sp.]